MIRFASPLPQNYDKIVAIFSDAQEEKVDAPLFTDEQRVVLQKNIEATNAETRRKKELTIAALIVEKQKDQRKLVDDAMAAMQAQIDRAKTEREMVQPEPSKPLEPITEDVKETPLPLVGTMGNMSMLRPLPIDPILPVTASPFVEKSTIVAPILQESELLQANPDLNDEFLQQRQALQDLRSAQVNVEEKYEEVKLEVPSQIVIEEAKQTFDEQQEALRRARAENRPPEKKQDAEKMLQLPPPNARSVKIVQRPPRIATTLSESKQQKDVEQALPPPNVIYAIETLRLDQLKLQCAKLGVSAKGNKADLILRLKERGVSTVSF